MKFVFLAVVLFVTGCATKPTTQIAAFGKSTSAITQLVDGVMDEYNNAVLERKFTLYAATYSGNHAGLLTSDELAMIQMPITPEQKQTFAIYRANAALGDYVQALGSLASAADTVDIDMAAANLYGSMVALNAQYKVLQGPDSVLFDTAKFARASTVITAIGVAVIEEKRREAIKEIVIDADPSIALICDEIIEQLKTAKIEDAIAASRKYILSEELIDYRERVKESTTLDWRRGEIKRLYNLQQGVYHSKLLVQQTQMAVAAVKQAHALLANELQAGRFSSAAIASTVGRLKELAKYYGDFESLLLSCRKITRNEMGVLSCDAE